MEWDLRMYSPETDKHAEVARGKKGTHLKGLEGEEGRKGGREGGREGGRGLKASCFFPF
jgi:hypothetical protein